MRRVKVFAGSSHPVLSAAICERLGIQPGKCELTNFSNGETSVSIGTSIRDQDVFIVQSGSRRINDSVMELLIMISACKSGSAKSITAVMPYFPYSRQSKKKSHRGAITARLVANLLSVAGIHHVITVDLHASQMQGFFGKPVDNLHAEPLIARWIRNNVQGWRDAVVVSKNPGGSKRVTSLADALKLNFGIITTDRRRDPVISSPTLDGSPLSEYLRGDTHGTDGSRSEELDNGNSLDPAQTATEIVEPRSQRMSSQRLHIMTNGTSPTATSHRHINGLPGSSPLAHSTRVDSESPPVSRTRGGGSPSSVEPASSRSQDTESADEYTDERARDVITGRLIHGHIVDDDYPSPSPSYMSASITTLGDPPAQPLTDGADPMTSSILSNHTLSSFPSDHALASTIDAAAASSEEEEEEEPFKNTEWEHTVTLVGNVRDHIVFIMDDMIDNPGSWIAAAETVVKRGGAKQVYCIATHGIFGDDCLDKMAACECIDYIVVTNSYPIDADKKTALGPKLVVLDISFLLAEAIRRNHYGENISALFQHYQDP